MLTQEELNQRLSIDEQESEIKRLRKLKNGELIAVWNSHGDFNVLETLLHRYKISYHLKLKDSKIVYCKGPEKKAKKFWKVLLARLLT